MADPEDPATFRSAVLDRSEQGDEPHASVLDWYRRLIALRQATPALTDGRLDLVTVALDDDAGTLLARRSDIAVALNIGDDVAVVPVPAGAAGPEVLLASDPDVALFGPGVRLPPDTVAVLRV